MSHALRASLREWAPPRLLRAYRRLRGESISFSGDFPDWEAARSVSSGYDDALIVERVRQATFAARENPDLMERDGVVLDAREQNYPLLASLQHAALVLGRLRVLDLGGALGGTWLQLRRYLPSSLPVQWVVVEQPGFVECGRQNFADAELSFDTDLNRVLDKAGVDVILLSSVLPYLERPRQTLATLLNAGCAFLLLDRTPILREIDRDRLTVQAIRLSEYVASYPAWFFSESLLLKQIGVHYDPVFTFDSFESWDLGELKSRSIGILFRKNRA